MRVAVDVTSLVGTRTGIGAFTDALITRLPRADLNVTAFAVTHRGADAIRPMLPASVKQTTRPMAARPLRWAWRHFERPRIEFWTGTIDVVHGPNFVVPPARSAAEVVTVHDLTCVRFPELCTPDTLRVPELIRRAIKRGAWIHTVSGSVALEVIEHFGADPARVVAIPNGAPAPVDPTDCERLAARGRVIAGSDQYVLGLGTVEPRKDFPALVAAFDAIADSRPDLRLVIAGPDGWGAEAVAKAFASAHHRDRIVRLGWVSDDDRDALLAGAAVFAYPSLYEGFGLPPLEALAHRTPVVATNTGALPEVLGAAAAWADVSNVDSLAEAISSVLDNETLGTDIVTAGLDRLAQFSWDTTVDSLVDLYRQAVEDRRALL
jgi:glycosyltransferase involved in cell wall biosynthesis